MSRKASIAIEGQTKICPKCGKDLLLEDYNKGNGKYGRRSICRSCEHLIQNTPEKRVRRKNLQLLKRQDSEYILERNEKDKIRKHTNLQSIKKGLVVTARSRAKKNNIEFNIDSNDFELPEYCPLLSIKLSSNFNMAQDNSYSLDRIDSTKGYVKENVWVISRRANAIKNNATLQELELLVTNLGILKRDHWIH